MSPIKFAAVARAVTCIERHDFSLTLDDLKKATPGIEKAVENYRRMAHAKTAWT
jgi:hypothetical protein